jgi:hypothetical protein
MHINQPIGFECEPSASLAHPLHLLIRDSLLPFQIRPPANSNIARFDRNMLSSLGTLIFGLTIEHSACATIAIDSSVLGVRWTMSQLGKFPPMNHIVCTRG